MDFNPSRMPKNPLDHDSPFDFFELPSQPPPKPPRFNGEWLERLKRFLLQYKWAMCLLAAAIGAMIVLSNGGETKHPFVFLEIKAIDPSGHPVAGAKIEVAKEIKGVTDSFGEWRRYLRLKPGSELLVKISKNTRHGLFLAHKVLSVPEKKNKNKEPELKTAIQLVAQTKGRRGSRAARPKEKTKEAREDVGQVRGISQALQQQEEPAREQEAEFERQEETPSAESMAVAGAVTHGDAFHRVAISLKLPQSRLTSKLHKQQKSIIEKKIYPRLKESLVAQGIALDASSPWHISLQQVAFPDHTTALKVEMKWGEGPDQQTAFLRQLTNSVEETTRQLVLSIRAHVPKNYMAFKHQRSWYVNIPSNTPALWQLRGGEVLRDAKGQAFPVTKEIISDNNFRLRLITADEKPCGEKMADNKCGLVAPTLKETAPIAGWRILKVKIIGDIPKGSQVFLSGYQAKRIAPTVWEYWGEPGTGANLTMVQGEKIVLRRRILDNDLQIPTVTIQETNVARR